MIRLALLTALGLSAPPLVAQEADWTGFTFGAEVGAGTIGNLGGDDAAQTYGLRAGYARDLGDVVLGARIVYDRIEVPGLADTENHYTALHLTAGYDLGRWQPYAIGGFASLTFRTPAPRRSDRGWLAGLGTAFALTDHDILSVEAIHHFNDDFHDDGVDRSGTFLTLAYDYRF